MNPLRTFLGAALISATTLTSFAQGTAFTYQGRLNVGANPANGLYDLQFGIYDAVTNGNQQGNLITNSATAVSNGLFTVTLDFGNQFPGAARWLEIGVRTNGNGAFATLSPRQWLAAIPYAVQAANALAASSVAAANLTGTIPLAQLPATVVTSGASGVNISGTFSGNGAGVTNVEFGTLKVAPGVLTWGNFILPSTQDVGAPRSASIVAVDANGAGRVDLITANLTANTLSVFTNNGSGGFVFSSSPAVGTNPVSVVAADVNGDGKVDLITANSGDNTLSVLTNDGSGGFVLSSTLAVGPNPSYFPSSLYGSRRRMSTGTARWI